MNWLKVNRPDTSRQNVHVHDHYTRIAHQSLFGGNKMAPGNNGRQIQSRRYNGAKRRIPAIRHIIWDWNGTLLDDAKACASAVDVLMRRRGMAGETLEGYRTRVKFPVRAYYLRAGFDLDKEDYDFLCDEFGIAYEEAISGFVPGEGGQPRPFGIHDDVRDVLSSFSALGVTHSIVSAAEEATLRMQVGQYGLQEHFIRVAGRDDNHGGTKTHLVEEWVKKCSFPPDQILYIGDTEHDCEAATASGIRVALVSDGHVDEKRLRDCLVPVYSNRRSLLDDVAPMTGLPIFRRMRFMTPIGEMGIVTDNLGVFHVDLPDAEPWPIPAGCREEAPDGKTRDARDALLRWFQNPSVKPQAALSILGTPFQREAWAAVGQLAPGGTASYGALALLMGRPGAARAVARALRGNPVPVFIPCHRVIGSDGTPTGYMGKRKNPLQDRLLAIEAGCIDSHRHGSGS
jgi:phosphoglycolate phosphatase